MPMTSHDIQSRLQANLAGARVVVEDLAGDGDHFKVIVTAEQFAGKTRVAQHQMVYAALGGAMNGELHALAIETHPVIPAKAGIQDF